jgi:anti-sigma28 factor (negative regulator of flagellin synthesis)
MISKVIAGSSAYLQQVTSKSDKKGSVSVEKTKEMDKVDSIKQQIQKGEYKLDSQTTAEVIAEDLM